MTGAPVSVSVDTVAGVFAPDRQLGLPHRQRPYAWTVEQVNRLLTDLMAACQAPVERRYLLLGRVLLVGDGSDGRFSIVDGHQRLVTLTILLSVLRDLETDPSVEAFLAGRVAAFSSDSASSGEPASGGFRLMPQTTLSRVLTQYVQSPGATVREVDEDVAQLSESEANVIANRDYIRARLTASDVTADLRQALARLLEESCWLIVQTMRDEDEAWRCLNDEESTGLDFSKTDYAKTTILSDLPSEERVACSTYWERWEHELGADDTLAVLTHTRVLLLRQRSERPIEIDICRRLMPRSGGSAFFRDELEPRALLLARLRRRDVGAGAARDDITRSLAYLTWIERQAWMPAAIRWLEARGGDDAQTPLFFRRLERIVWLQKIANVQPAEREIRIIDVVQDIDAVADVEAFGTLAVERELRNHAVAGLREKGFYRRRHCGSVLRRLTMIAGNDLTFAERGDLTVEHVLPSRPRAGSRWFADFTNRARVRSYADRLGNLTLLTAQENNLAGSEEFAAKQGVLTGSVVALAREAAGVAAWTPQFVNERTDGLIARLFVDWELPPP